MSSNGSMKDILLGFGKRMVDVAERGVYLVLVAVGAEGTRVGAVRKKKRRFQCLGSGFFDEVDSLRYESLRVLANILRMSG